MSDLDLNLLRVVVALDEHRSVSSAALKLGRSQPSVSADLAKLRKFFDDPLFLRAGNNMQPTPRAQAIATAARPLLDRITADIVAPRVFDPFTHPVPYKMALSDVGEVIFLPPVLKHLREFAPDAAVWAVSLPPTGIAEQLESGDIDVAIGYFPDLKKRNFFQQTLFTDGFVSLMRADHPLAAKGKLTIEEFTQLDHAVVRVESRTEEVIERYLARNNIRRRVVLTTPHFASAPIIVAQSDLIVTVPQPLARYFSGVLSTLKMVELPFVTPTIEVKQFWHRKFHHDARNRWLRTLIARLFQSR